MDKREIFKRELPKYMDKAGMKQIDLAKALGMSKSSVHCWVNGKAFPEIDTIQKIADVLGCETDDLLMEEVQNTAPVRLSFPSMSQDIRSSVVSMLDSRIEEAKSQNAMREISYQNELKMMSIYRHLTEEGQAYLLQQAEIAKKMFSKK